MGTQEEPVNEESSQNFWPSGADRLIRDVLSRGAAAPISAEEQALLPIVVSAALDGQDIAALFPGFYRAMLANPGLQEAFLDALQPLEAEHPGWPAEALEPPADPSIDRLSSNRCRISWRQGLDQLRAIFFPAAPAAAYRSDDAALDDLTLPLLRSQARLPDRVITVALFVTQRLETPDRLHPYASVAQQAGNEDLQTPASGLRVSLQWGGYQADAETAAGGRADFPAIPVAEIIAASGEQVRAPLLFSLETPASQAA